LRLRLIPWLGTAASVAALGFAAPALASSEGFQTRAGKLVRAKASPFAAGYESSAKSDTAVSVTTTIVVPAVKNCGDAKKVVIPFVAADGDTMEGVAAGLDIHCRHGRVIYFPIFNAGGSNKAFASAHVRRGDEVSLRLSWNATKLSLAVVDKTHPSATRTLTGVGSSSFSQPSIGDSIIGNPPAPVPDFGKIVFSKSKINGRALGRAPGLTRANLVNASHVVQIKTGPIASDQESFTTTFKHS
jgi:hypothetical protein